MNTDSYETVETILVVDDSKVDARILIDALQKDYRVIHKESPFDTLEFICSNRPPDLILMDVVMPQMDGFQLCKRIQSEMKFSDVPIIFITTQNREEDEAKGLEAGAVDYITKPFRFPIIKARIKTQLELKRKRQFLENLSMIDGLTGIANRRRLDMFLEAEWHRCILEKIPMSAMILDVDYFKLYNDHYGHLIGDECLKQLAHALTEVILRPTDLLARYGGEEFSIVLPNTGASGISFLAKMVKKRIDMLAIPHIFSSISEKLTVSMGGATLLPSRETSPATILEQADKALYFAKENGRNQFHLIDLR